MKIMQICFSPIINSVGGAEKVYCNMANYFVNKYDVINVCCDNEDGRPYYRFDKRNKLYNIGKGILKSFPIWLKIKQEIIRVFRKCGIKKEFPKERYLRGLIRNNLNNILNSELPDIVICYELRSMVLLKELGFDLKKVIVMFHSSALIIYKELDFKQKSILCKVGAVQVLLESDKKFLNEKGFQNVVCIGNIVPEVKCNQLCLKENVILCVGRLDRKVKRQHLLIEAFSTIAYKYKNWSLLIYGGNSNCLDYENELQKIINKNKLEMQIKLMGTTNNIIDVMKKSKIFVLPSSYEGFPLALTEAMAVGLPCIGFKNTPGVNELIEHKHNGFLVNNIKELSDKLELLINNENICNILGQNGSCDMQLYKEENIMPKWDYLINNL